jgi:hypothetical protein
VLGGPVGVIGRSLRFAVGRARGICFDCRGDLLRCGYEVFVLPDAYNLQLM